MLLLVFGFSNCVFIYCKCCLKEVGGLIYNLLDLFENLKCVILGNKILFGIEKFYNENISIKKMLMII